MKLMVRFGVMFYCVVTLLAACLLAAIALQLMSVDEIAAILLKVNDNLQIRLILGLVALVLVMKAYTFAKVIYGDQQKGKNIAFDNPEGRVYVSLTALEDLVRRELSSLEEVKEVRASVSAKKNGDLYIESRVSLNGDINIPEVTSKLQGIIKTKIQNMIGAEMGVEVEVAVVKIVPRSKDKKLKVSEVSKETKTNVPFEGYRA